MDDRGATACASIFAGDTGYGHWFAEIGERYPGIDIAMLPIGAYATALVHASRPHEPGRRDRSLSRRRGRRRSGTSPRCVPIHWGTFRLTDEPMDEPPRRLTAAWADAGHDAQSLWLLQHGETRARRQA